MLAACGTWGPRYRHAAAQRHQHRHTRRRTHMRSSILFLYNSLILRILYDGTLPRAWERPAPPLFRVRRSPRCLASLSCVLSIVLVWAGITGQTASHSIRTTRRGAAPPRRQRPWRAHSRWRRAPRRPPPRRPPQRWRSGTYSQPMRSTHWRQPWPHSSGSAPGSRCPGSPPSWKRARPRRGQCLKTRRAGCQWSACASQREHPSGTRRT